MARSYLLRLMKPHSLGNLVLDLKIVLKRALSPAMITLLDAVRDQAEEQQAPLYIVGGFVRDLLLGRPNLDLDLVVEGDAIRLGRQLVKKFGGHLLAHKAFCTAVWSLDSKTLSRKLHSARKLPEFIDLTSARRERYAHSGALPKVEVADIRADQYRRDFSINTMALRLDGPQAGMLLDSFNGIADLRRSLIRVLHPQSFSDDPTRILRALRLAGRLGFKIEGATLNQLKTSIRFLDAVSGERVRTELELILGEPKRVAILRTSQKLGVLAAIHPRMRFDNKTAQALRVLFAVVPSYWELGEYSVSQLAFVLWLMHFSERDVLAISDRLQMDAKLRNASVAVARLVSQRASLRSLRPSDLVDELEKVPMLSIYALYMENRGNKLGKLLGRYAQKWRHVRPRVDGNTLRHHGLPPGPAYSQILARLRAARLNGEVKTARQENALLEKLISEYR